MSPDDPPDSQPEQNSIRMGWWLPKQIADAMIRFYQVAISPLFGPKCRFSPTCSQYAREAIAKYGVLRGGWKSIKRIARCNPLFPGGHDPVD